LAFSRREAVAPRVVDPNEVVRGIDKMLQRLLGERVQLHTVLGQDSEHVRIDPGLLEQVLVNLAVNARDAMPEGGAVTIRTEGAQARRPNDDEPITVVRIAVEDSGSGMDSETQRRIFEPFFTTKEVGRGTGLGLATCQSIVRQAGGWIELDSEPGRGTTFGVCLPRVDEEKTRGTSGAPVTALRGTETVLVAEDDAQVRAFVVRALEQHGYRVLAADNGSEALALAEVASVPVELLISDVVMPGMTAQELARRLQQQSPKLRVLYVSGYAGSAGTETPQGADLLRKPFGGTELARRVRAALDAK
jgi:CheY-like chemotaxis protein